MDVCAEFKMYKLDTVFKRNILRWLTKQKNEGNGVEVNKHKLERKTRAYQ